MLETAFLQPQQAFRLLFGILLEALIIQTVLSYPEHLVDFVRDFLLDFSGDIYGHEASVVFVERLRDEETYDSAEALSQQIALDVEQTRLALR